MKCRHTLLLFGALFSMSSVSTLALAETRMQWQRIPLNIDLNVNQERIIFVDRNVKVGLPLELDDNKINVQSMGGAVYLTAKQPFDTNRIQLRDVETGEIILLDLKSRESNEKLDSVRVVTENLASNQPSVGQTTISDPNFQGPPQQAQSALPAPAALTRYAAQSLYAPLRTVEPVEGIRRVANNLPKTIPNLMPNLNLIATPLESWGLDGYVVTAVRLKNQADYRVTLDPRYLQGYFYAATFQHNWLGAKGTPEDTTVVYIVTEGKPANAFIFNQGSVKSATKKVIKTVKKEVSQ